jgi:transposase
MAFNFISSDPDQGFLLPPDARDWLPPGHRAWQVIEVVGELDLSAFQARYRADGQGRPAFDPAVMVGLLLYCYAKGVRSSRAIERSCWDDVGCRVITSSHVPDHATIARFVSRHRRALKQLFVQALALCARQGLVNTGVVAVDGSPLEANAALASNRTLDQLEIEIAELEAAIAAEVEEMFADAERAEAAEQEELGGGDGDDGGLPAQLSRHADRLIRAQRAKTKLAERAAPSQAERQARISCAERAVEEARQRLAEASAAQQARIDEHARRAAEQRALGRNGATGRPPAPLESKAALVRSRQSLQAAQECLKQAYNPTLTPSATAQASVSDPDSRLLPGKHGGYLQGYNLQIAAARNQILLAIGLHDNPSDSGALTPMVAAVKDNCQAAGIGEKIRAWLADNGYASTANFEALAEEMLLVAVAKEAKQTGRMRPSPTAKTPEGWQRMAARLATPAGKSLYKRRGAIVEPAFAQLFQRFGRYVNYRGTEAVDAEVKLLGAAHNLCKLFTHQVKVASLAMA